MRRVWTVTVAIGIVLLAGAVTNGAVWNVPEDFTTIQEAIDSATVLDGDRIMVGPGNHAGAVVTKAVEIKGDTGASINTGPLLTTYKPCGTITLDTGFFFTGAGAGSGATISHLSFDNVAFPVFSRGADDVTVSQCKMANPIQGVTNWGGSRWKISHNLIIDLRSANGGGIGIIVAERFGGVVEDNVISHNKISGTLHVASCDGGGYAGTGIVLYADFRSGRLGATAIQYNRVVKNKISLKSDNPEVVDVGAFELTEHGTVAAGWPPDPPDPPTIVNNTIGFNDFRGTDIQISLSPEELDTVNTIDRNLGNNRGHGLTPASLFAPGGK
ncbi:MAG: hypothetical protein JSU70_04110 [Phycisphaerales bacterium]|nr:MAG: hypothetical protein JSU70_04110 [Phycisphaerales bacterium]